MKSFQIHPIKHLGNPPRVITSMCGIPFYQSSGESSGYPATWFPFWGILDEDILFFPNGFYLKPEKEDISLPSAVQKAMTELFPSYGSYDQGEQLLQRFSNLPALWISSQLGGGLWEMENGKKLLKFLNENYFCFYESLPTIKLLPIAFETDDVKKINTWLCQQAQVENYKKLKDKFFQNLNEFSFYLKIKETEQRQKNLLILACVSVSGSILVVSYLGLTLGVMVLLAIQIAFLACVCLEFQWNIEKAANWLPLFKNWNSINLRPNERLNDKTQAMR